MSWFKKKNENDAQVHEVTPEMQMAMAEGSRSETSAVKWEKWDLDAFAQRGEVRKKAVGSRFKGWGEKLRRGFNIALATPEMARAAGNIATDKAAEVGREAWDAASAKYGDVRENVVASVDEMKMAGQEAWATAKETWSEGKRQAVDTYNGVVNGITTRATSAYQLCEGKVNGWLDKIAERARKNEITAEQAARGAKVRELIQCEERARQLRAELLGA